MLLLLFVCPKLVSLPQTCAHRDTQVAVLNIMGALYASSTFLGIANAMTVLPVVNNEHVVYYRERASGMYASLPYAMAQVW